MSLTPTETYVTTLKLTSDDRNALIMDIAMVLNSMNAKVRALSSRDVGNGRALTTLSLEVRSLEELNAVISRLTAVPGVREVQRVNG